MTHYAVRTKSRFVKLPVSSYRFWKKALLVHRLLVKWLYYNRLYVLEPYLWPATNGNAKKKNCWPLARSHTSNLPCAPSAYLWRYTRDFAYQALLHFSVQHWKAGNGPGDEAMCYYNTDSVSNELLRHSWKTLSTLLLWRLHTLGNALLTVPNKCMC